MKKTWLVIHYSDFEDFDGLQDRINTLLDQKKIDIYRVCRKSFTISGTRKILSDIYDTNTAHFGFELTLNV